MAGGGGGVGGVQVKTDAATIILHTARCCGLQTTTECVHGYCHRFLSDHRHREKVEGRRFQKKNTDVCQVCIICVRVCAYVCVCVSCLYGRAHVCVCGPFRRIFNRHVAAGPRERASPYCCRMLYREYSRDPSLSISFSVKGRKKQKKLKVISRLYLLKIKTFMKKKRSQRSIRTFSYTCAAWY